MLIKKWREDDILYIWVTASRLWNAKQIPNINTNVFKTFWPKWRCEPSESKQDYTVEVNSANDTMWWNRMGPHWAIKPSWCQYGTDRACGWFWGRPTTLAEHEETVDRGGRGRWDATLRKKESSDSLTIGRFKPKPSTRWGAQDCNTKPSAWPHTIVIIFLGLAVHHAWDDSKVFACPWFYLPPALVFVKRPWSLDFDDNRLASYQRSRREQEQAPWFCSETGYQAAKADDQEQNFWADQE